MQENMASRSFFLKMDLERVKGALGCFTTSPISRVFYSERAIVGKSLHTMLERMHVPCYILGTYHIAGSTDTWIHHVTIEGMWRVI